MYISEKREGQVRTAAPAVGHGVGVGTVQQTLELRFHGTAYLEERSIEGGVPGGIPRALARACKRGVGVRDMTLRG
eukprot:353327-Chlamydomonas_euryale.AAC.5